MSHVKTATVLDDFNHYIQRDEDKDEHP